MNMLVYDKENNEIYKLIEPANDVLQKRRQQEETAVREAEIKREIEEKRRIIEEEKRQAEIKRQAEQRFKEEEERKRKEAEEEERRRREEEEREKKKKKIQIPEWKRKMLERQKAEKNGEKAKPSRKTSVVSKTSTGKGGDSEGAAEVAEKLGSLRRGLEKKQGQLKEEAKEAKKGPSGKAQKKSY